MAHPAGRAHPLVAGSPSRRGGPHVCAASSLFVGEVQNETMKRFLMTLVVTWAFFGTIQASPGETHRPEPATQDRVSLTASFDPAQASPGDTVTLVVTAKIQKGFHLYGKKEQTGIPIALAVTRSAGLTAASEPQIPDGEEHQSVLGSEYWLDDLAVVKQRFVVPKTQAAGSLRVAGEFRYQACTKTSCERPNKATFEARLSVVEGKPKPAPSAEAPWKKTKHLRYRATFEPAEADPGDQVQLRVEVEVGPTWHVYGALEETGVKTSIAITEAAGLTSKGAAKVPDGESHDSFGIISHWIEGTFVITQTFVVPENAQGTVTLKGNLDYMACTPETCDPPTKTPFEAALRVNGKAGSEGEVPEAPGSNAGTTNSGERLAPGNATEETDPGKPQDATWQESTRLRYRASFHPASASVGDTVELRVEVQVNPGWHVYGSLEEGGIPTSLTILGAKGLKAGELQVPEGEMHESFGLISYWVSDTFHVVQRFVVQETAASRTKVRGELNYMACDDRTCDRESADPFDAVLVVKRGIETGEGDVESGEGSDGGVEGGVTPDALSGGNSSSDENVPDEEGTEDVMVFDGGEDPFSSFWAFIVAAIGAGLFALAMPCTYPMIPITISFFTKQADARGGKVLPLALAYGLGIISIFVIVGVVFGSVIQQFAAHYVTNLVIGVLFLVFALSLFGMFELRPPAFLLRASSQASMKGGYFGVFLMGATLVVTSFTCTAPFMGTLLAAGTSLSKLDLAIGMGTFGLTMALPFMVLALLPGKVKSLPKSGEWMHTLKVFLGFVEFAAALKFFSNVEYSLGMDILPKEYFLMIWGVIFFLAGFYLLGKIKLVGEMHEGITPGRMLASTFVLLFGTYCAYGSFGYPLDEITTAIVPPYSVTLNESDLIVKDDYDAAVARAKELRKKVVLVNFTGYN